MRGNSLELQELQELPAFHRVDKRGNETDTQDIIWKKDVETAQSARGHRSDAMLLCHEPCNVKAWTAHYQAWQF